MMKATKMQMIRKHQSGVVILEVLVSIVIFAVGVLGIIGLQAATAQTGIDARFRTEAATIADELIARAQIWDDVATLATNFQGADTSGGAEYQAWYSNRLALAGSGLPDAKATVAFPAPFAGTAAGTLMTVELSWLAPGADFRSSHTTVAALPGGGG
jgi:type IV pilus assembly protein PilV